MARPPKDIARATPEFAKQCRKVQQSLMLDLFGFKQGIEIRRFAQLWGCPVGTAHSDLFAVLGWLRLFFHKHGAVLREIIKASEVEPALAAQLQRAKASRQDEESQLARLKRQKLEGSLCDKKVIHEFLAKLADRLRSEGERAQRQWGTDGFEMFNGLEIKLREDLRQMFEEPQHQPSEIVISTAKKKSRRGKK